MTRILLAMMFFIALAASVSAQVRVTGRVMALSPSSGGAGGGPMPVSDVIVKLVKGYGSAGEARECGCKTLAFTSSNAQGEYSLELKSAPSGEVTLLFTHISYEKESLPLPPPKEGGKPIVQDMVLTPKAVSLKEVTVKPDPLRQKGDTLTHNLASILRPFGSKRNLHGNASVTPIQWLELCYDIRYGWSETHPQPLPVREGSEYTQEQNSKDEVTSPLHYREGHGGGSFAIHVFPIATLDLSLDYDHVRRQLPPSRGDERGAYKRMFGLSKNAYSYDYGLCGRTALLRATVRL